MKSREERITWFREARFGMFVHWGIYSLLGKAEWIMHNEDIPRDEYRKLAADFNPVKFDAEYWAQVMQDAGMKYIVITAKHHDGFAMFKSHCSDYNIVDATPFTRDPMAELAEACGKRDIKLCFYYSHVQDWYEHRVGWNYPQLGKDGKNWYSVTEKEAAEFNTYYESKCKPQIRELLTQYGPIGLLWFDTPIFFTEEQAIDLATYIRGIQPDCLINGRLLNKQFYPERIPDIDYEGMGDSEVPPLPSGIDWEAPMTSCNGWGYRDPETTVWKSEELLLSHLIRMSASGGNYLLNIGPSPLGELPQSGVDRFRGIGTWLKTNAESIYGTSGNPFGHDFEWGTATCKSDRIYLHLKGEQRGPISVKGLKNKISSIYLLSDPDRKILEYQSSFDNTLSCSALEIGITQPLTDSVDNVLVVETDGDIEIEQPTSQLADGRISLPGALALVHRHDTASTTQLEANGIIGSWFDPKDWIEWEFKVAKPGSYRVEIVERADFWGMHKWDYGHVLKISAADRVFSVTLGKDGILSGEGAHLNKTTVCGEISITSPGVYSICVKPEHISTEYHWGLRIQSLEILPTQN